PHLALAHVAHLLDGEAEAVAHLRGAALREGEEVDGVPLAHLPGEGGAGAKRLVVRVGEDVEEGHWREGERKKGEQEKLWLTLPFPILPFSPGLVRLGHDLAEDRLAGA